MKLAELNAVRSVLLVASGAALACGTLRSSSEGSTATMNSCSASPCAAYLQENDVVCSTGVCVVNPTGGPSTSDLVVLVALPDDAFFAAGLTFANPFSSLTSGSDASVPPPPATLSNVVFFPNAYTVTPQLAQTVGWDLGSPPGDITSLPFHATFRLLWPQAGDTFVEAESLGLPIEPVEGDSIQVGAVGYPGPGGGSETESLVFLPPATYEQTWTPDPPFNQAFGPVTQLISAFGDYSPSRQTIDSYDTTGGAQPELQISRQGGVLDGWTAYLRDTQTKRAISNTAPLAGTASTVIFAVKRMGCAGVVCSQPQPAQPDLDALSGVELVVAPPANEPVPTGVFNLFDMLSPVLYPLVPPPVTVTGHVYAANGANVDATLIFEATSVAAANFEFTTSITATGGSPYSVTLPPGQYQVDVRPSSTALALSVVSAGIEQNEQLDFVVGAPQTVTGAARVADGRPLAGAMVDAIGVQCVSTATSSTECLPRSTVAATDVHGSYALQLDPGSYTIRVRPADGTRLPWVTVPEPLVVDGVSAPVLANVIVPAPMAVGLTLDDPSGNPIANALVRVFRMPSQSAGASASSTAVELGEAMTGTDGSYEMYVAPPSL